MDVVLWMKFELHLCVLVCVCVGGGGPRDRQVDAVTKPQILAPEILCVSTVTDVLGGLVT